MGAFWSDDDEDGEGDGGKVMVMVGEVGRGVEEDLGIMPSHFLRAVFLAVHCIQHSFQAVDVIFLCTQSVI